MKYHMFFILYIIMMTDRIESDNPRVTLAGSVF